MALTLTSLLGAYLDLAISYLFLVCATAAFFASKLLSLVGISLPCAFYLRCPFDSLLAIEDRRLPPLLDPAPEEPLSQPNLLSAEAASAAAWSSDFQGLKESVADNVKNDSCYGIRSLIGCDEGVRLDARSLERELEVHRRACAALCLELEKERSAASSAADEAMAMISRVQREKAELDMEARQYQRLVEEKSAYDKEEMDILKEIILKRDREKHALEKEVEMYKQMMNSGEIVDQEFQAFDSDENLLEYNLDTLADFSDDPIEMLSQMFKSNGKFSQIFKSNGKKNDQKDFGVQSSLNINSSIANSNNAHPIQNFVGVKKHDELLNSADDSDQEFQEKSILTTHSNPLSSNITSTSSADDSNLYNFNAPFETDYHKDTANVIANDGRVRGGPIESKVSVDGRCRIRSEDTDQRCSESSELENESNILDVHVIDDAQLLQVEEDSNQVIVASEEESSCTNFDELELSIGRSCSDITNRMSLSNNLPWRASKLNLQSSLPTIESGSYKLENDVDILRKRLEIIRQGREKLSLTAFQKKKETLQFTIP